MRARFLQPGYPVLLRQHMLRRGYYVLRPIGAGEPSVSISSDLRTRRSLHPGAEQHRGHLLPSAVRLREYRVLQPSYVALQHRHRAVRAQSVMM